MKPILCCTAVLVCFSCWLFPGCEFEPEPVGKLNVPTASTVVVNEVFTLPLSNPSTFSWIELYNPTGNTVDLGHFFDLTFTTNDSDLTTIPKWTVSLTTNAYVVKDTVVITIDSVGTEVSRTSSFTPVQQRVVDTLGYGVFDVPLTGFILPPGQLLTLVNNENRFLDHTRWGPADPSLRFEAFAFVSFDSVDTIRTIYVKSVVDSTRDSLALRFFKIIFTLYTIDLYQLTAAPLPFHIQPRGQIVLKDPAGTIVDVVRMGDSVYTNVMGDSSRPLLSIANRSIGNAPEFESIARFAEGYFTANTANDFYITRIPPLTTAPTPHGPNPLPK